VQFLNTNVSFRLAFLWAGVFTFLLCSTGLYAQQTESILSQFKQYKISYWTTDDGLPGNTLISLTQDKDGYLWIGSYEGLVRFDGSEFDFFTKNNTPQLKSFHARALISDNRGNVWIGTGFGLVRYNNGIFTDVGGSEHDFFIESLWLDESNLKIWIGTRDSGLYTYDILNNTYQHIDNLFRKDLINAVVPDDSGGIWVGSEENGLAYFYKGEWTYYGVNEGLLNTEINSLYFDNTTGLYIGTTSGLFLMQGKKISIVKQFENLRINRVRIDAQGVVWVASVMGIHYADKSGNWNLINKDKGLSNNDVRDIYFDRVGNVWLATYRGGLNKLMETNFINFSGQNGLVLEASGAMCQVGKNKYLIASTDGKLFAWENGLSKLYPLKTKITQRIYNMLYDEKQNLWLASYDGLLLIKPDGTEKLFTEKDGLPTSQLRIVYQDRNKNYWLGSRTGGIIKMNFKSYPDKPEFQTYHYNELNELNSTFIMSIEEDSEGNLLVGSNTGGVNRITRDGIIQNFSIDQGLISNVTYSARSDKDGVVWIATSDGIGRLENDSITNFSKQEGLPQESVFDIVEDAQGYFWLPSAKGIIRVEKKQLNDYKKGLITTIDWKLYDKSNELIRSECTGATRVYRGADNTLWFFVLGGLVGVDPLTMKPDNTQPKVFIRKVFIDDAPVDMHKPIVVEPENQRIAFLFTGLNWRYPKSLRYRYRLENFDKDWIEAGNDRQTVYTNIPPGEYTFQVLACNADGVWGTEPATISVVVVPHFYQTSWFFMAVFITVATGIFVYIRVRIWGLRKQTAMLERVVKERTREIASQRDELVVLNEEIRASQEEVMAQRDALAEKNSEIERMNANLEKIVADRTRVLEEQNERLAEYAFINAHKLRAPLASILGIINLLLIEKSEEQKHVLLDHLQKSSISLDYIVRSINQMLEKEFGKSDDKTE
jgi:ligand-binding sensor domain-containing protein